MYHIKPSLYAFIQEPQASIPISILPWVRILGFSQATRDDFCCYWFSLVLGSYWERRKRREERERRKKGRWMGREEGEKKKEKGRLSLFS